MGYNMTVYQSLVKGYGLVEQYFSNYPQQRMDACMHAYTDSGLFISPNLLYFAGKEFRY